MTQARRTNPDTGLPYPEPTTPEPSMDDITAMVNGDTVFATDGCVVEPDGCCCHGYCSWLIQLNII